MGTADADTDAETETPDVQRVLPDGPLSESTVDVLRDHDRVQALTPMKVDHTGGMQVYDFVIAFESVAYALRYEDDWTIISKGDDEQTVGVALQEYHHEHGVV